jgi:hypothetical protein
LFGCKGGQADLTHCAGRIHPKQSSCNSFSMPHISCLVLKRIEGRQEWILAHGPRHSTEQHVYEAAIFLKMESAFVIQEKGLEFWL